MTTATDMPTRKMQQVRDLLNLAEHPNTSVEEAEAAMNAAARLMAKYQIDEAVARAMGAPTVDRGEPIFRVIVIKPAYAVEKCHVANQVARHFGCKGIMGKEGRGVVHFTVFGFEDALDMFEMTFTSLLLQITGQLKTCDGLIDDSTDSLEQWKIRQGYILGFASSIAKRFQEIRDLAQQDIPAAAATGVGLAVIDDAARIEAALRAVFARTGRTGRIGGSASGAGFQSGAAAGGRADIGQSRVGNTRRAIGR
jgi:hypothetical protein